MMLLYYYVLNICFSFIICKKNNVLLIIIDDLKPALECYGDSNSHTPNINALAKKSFIFTNAFAQQALCAPSRNSFLTSRRPDSLRLYDVHNYWRTFVGNFTSLPQHFKENGYYSHSIGKVFHPGFSSNFSDDSPYSWSGVPFHPKTEKYKDAKVCINSDESLSDNLICPVNVEFQPSGTLPDLESLEAAKDFLRNRKITIKNKPYFLAVGFHKPHIPFKFPQEYLKHHPIENITLPKNRWRPALLPTVAWNPWTDIRVRDDIKQMNISFPFGVIPDIAIKRIIQSYNAATTYIDDLIGQLLQEIGKDTIILLMSDHGWSYGEHGEFAKYSNFEIATRVPLLIHVPGMIKRAIIIDELVELVDIFPTLVDLTEVSNSIETCDQNGSNLKLCTEGKSMAQVMASKIYNKDFSGKSAIFTQYPRPGTYPTITPNSDQPNLKDIKIMGYSIKTTSFRYTEWIRFNSNNFTRDWNTAYGRELYCHLIDPEENMNLVDRHELNQTANELRKKLILGWRFV